ncbi:MAG: hypothetical protein AB1589_25595 [Cyanobacteriota bacterium]
MKKNDQWDFAISQNLLGTLFYIGFLRRFCENRISHLVIAWHNVEHLLDVNVKNIGVMHSVERFLNENKPLQSASTRPLTTELATQVGQFLTGKVQFFWSVRLT